MAEGTGSDQHDVGKDPGLGLPRDKIIDLVAKVDAVMPSPSDRALKVWSALNKADLTIWDLMCFTVEAQGYMMPLFPEFEHQIKHLNLAIYSTHYFRAESIAQWEQELPEKI